MSMPHIVARDLVYNGWYKFYRLVLQWSDGKQFERHLLDNGSAVAVLPFDAERKVCLLISQPRAPVIAAGEAPLLEVIAGNLDGADSIDQARTEALEEAGLVLGQLERVTNIWSLSPVSSERIALFLAPYCSSDQIGPGGGAAHEDEWITVHEVSLPALKALVDEGHLTDAKTLILAQALMLRRPDLWS